mgnify:CR=1 FL=1
MTTMRRVYLPLTEQQLTGLRETRELADRTSPGFAVTDAVRVLVAPSSSVTVRLTVYVPAAA